MFGVTRVRASPVIDQAAIPRAPAVYAFLKLTLGARV
jgi:hypothetical protein